MVNPIGCNNCHDDKTAELKARVPYLDRALLKEAGLKTFDESTHQEKRSLVCAQCHVEYYFKKTEWKDAKGVDKTAMVVTYPWANGIGKEGNSGTEGMIKYYDEIGFSDWTHNISKTPMLKAQHPDYEFWKTGIHGQKGVSCADCHMPYTQEGSVKYSEHQVLENPLNEMDRTCMNCHRESEEKLRGIVHQKYERKEFLNKIAFDNIAKAHLETGKAMEVGASDAELKEVRRLIRHGQFKGDMAIAAHGNYFHAPEETLRLLSAANEDAQNARLLLVRILAKKGVMDYSAPDFDTKEKAQALVNVDMAALSAEKMKFKQTLEQAWKEEAVAKGRLHPTMYKDADTINDGQSCVLDIKSNDDLR
jgi:nitrite reductase (cytochrome c-552)